MSLSYDIDSAKQIVFIQVLGRIDIADIDALVEEIRNAPSSTQSMGVLIDARELKRAFFVREMDRLLSVIAGQKADFVDRYAFIVANDVALGAGRRFAIKARRKGLELEVFSYHNAAVNWLGESRQG